MTINRWRNKLCFINKLLDDDDDDDDDDGGDDGVHIHPGSRELEFVHTLVLLIARL